MCEAALRLREDSPSGWALLATLRLEEGASASASECIRRGQLATHRLEKSLGLSLTTLQLSLRLLRGRVHRAASQLPEADAEFEAVAEAASASGGSAATVLQALQGRAEVALAGDDHVAARDRLDLVLERSPQHPWALSQRGQLALAGGDTSAAISDLQAAVALRPRDAHLHLLLGRAYWEAGGELRQRTGTGGAQAEFLEAAKLQPSNGPAFRHLGHFYRQVAGDHPRAQRCYLRAVALDAADSEAGEALCELLSEGGQGALRDATCRDAAQRSAKAYWAWRTLGLSQVAGRQWEAAVTSLQHALRGLSSDPALALAYQRLGRHTAALKAYGRGRKLQQQQGEDNSRQQGTFAVVQCGNIHLLLSAFAEAEECFREALAAAPGQVAAKYGLASALYGRAQQCVQSGAPAWAASLLQEAEAPAGECAREHGHLESAWKLLGDIQLLSSQVTPHGARLVLGGGEKPMEPEGDHHRLKESAPARAVRSYKKGLHLRPGGAAARADLAVGLCHLAAFEETPAGQHSVRRAAEKVMAGALRLQPDSAHLWALMGALAQSGPLKQHALIRSLQLEPSCAPAWAGLSQLYLAEGEEELAERAVAQARASNPSHPLPWAVTAILHFNASARQPSEAHLEEAYASSLYAAQQYPIPALQGALGAMAAHTRKLATHQVYAALGQAAALTPGRPGVQNLLGMAAEAQGLFSDAVAAYMAARDCHQCGALADRASQADAPDQQPGTKENMACVSRNLARALSKDSDTWQAYAVALHASRQDDLALAAAQQAVSAAEEATPAHRRAIGLLCSLFFRSGDVKSALAAFGSAPLAYRRDDEGLALTAIAAAASLESEAALQQVLALGGGLAAPPAVLCATASALQLQVAGGRRAHLAPRLVPLKLHVPDGSSSDYTVTSAVHAEVALGCPSAIREDPANMETWALLIRVTLALGASSRRQLPLLGASLRMSEAVLARRPPAVPPHVRLSALLAASASCSHLSTLQGLDSSATDENSRGSYAEGAEARAAAGPEFSRHRQENASDHAAELAALQRAVKYATDARQLARSAGLSEAPAIHQLARCHLAARDGVRAEKAADELMHYVEVTTVNAKPAKNSSPGMHSADNSTLLVQLSLADAFIEHDLIPKAQALLASCEGQALSQEDSARWLPAIRGLQSAAAVKEGDVALAQVAAADGLADNPEASPGATAGAPVLHALHGLASLELFRAGRQDMLLVARRSLLRAVASEALPGVSCALAEAERAASGGRAAGVAKWQALTRQEWATWPSGQQPPALYYEMALLAASTEGALEQGRSCKAWMQLAVRGNPARNSYWANLRRTHSR
eukprot:jgi/Mesen1/6464/ME000033S05750